MNIIYIGNFIPPYSTENYVAKTLEDLGHKVLKLQENETDLDYILEIQKDFDFILYTRTWDNCKGDREKFLKEKKIPFIGYSLDIWWGLEREKEIDEQLFFKTDLLFTADGGHQKEFKEKGIKHIWLPAGIYDKECFYQKKSFKNDLIFVGSYNYHLEYPFRKDLIDWLKENYSYFKLFGQNTQTIRGTELNRLYASTKIVIGDSFESLYYWSYRIYETLGRGGFLLHPYTIGLDKEFKDKVHYVGYKRYDWTDLKRKIDYYLKHDKEREKIRLKGFLKVKSNYTYKHRLTKLINYVKRFKIQNTR